MAAGLEHLPTIFADGYPEGPAYRLLNELIGRIDAVGLQEQILGSHLDEALHDEAVHVAGGWNDYEEKLDLLRADLIASTEHKSDGRAGLNDLNVQIRERKATLRENTKALAKKIADLTPKLTAVYQANQRRLVRIGRAVAAGSDD
jgi:hypothetical protein